MSNWIIYHNPKCSKSREALALLKEKGIEPQIIEYLKTPPTETDLRNLLAKLSTPPSALVRTKEDLYQELQFDLSSPDEVVQNLAAHPSLLERPIVVKDDRAVIARPTEIVFEFLKS